MNTYPPLGSENTFELVSVVTPMFNSEQYVPTLLESVLRQTYPRIEMIVIDDGSTDSSAGVVRDFIPKYEARGYSLTLVQQSNQGQSAAIFNVLPKVTGKYLVWPDSDDFYATDDAIAKMVSALEKAGDGYASVRAQRRRINEKNGEIIEIQGLNFIDYEDNSLFYDALESKNGWFFGVGAFLIDFEKFKRITGLKMYHRKGTGQNWQLMLPVLYGYRCVSVREILLDVIDREDSHSHLVRRNIFTNLMRNRQFMEKLIYTVWIIKDMPISERLACSRYSVNTHGGRYINLLFRRMKSELKKAIKRYAR